MEGQDPRQVRQVRAELAGDFNRICGYCEQPCEPTTSVQFDNEESVDHFRPQDRFPNLTLDWLNLIYACYRCNQAKGGSWPGFDDRLVDALLVAEDARYTPVSEYVNPNMIEGQRPAQDFFAFDGETREITPSEQLDTVEWSMARRTIGDIDLNDSNLGENEPRHLWNLRLDQIEDLEYEIDKLQDFDEKVEMMLRSMLPDNPFSGFITAYITRRFPALAQLLQQQ
jgi:uncharacterized protein (TIGR02646 family)